MPSAAQPAPAPELDPTEETALLGYDATSDAELVAVENPLPKLTMVLLTMTRLTEPLCVAVYVPFVNAMVLNTGQVSVERVGYYVGAIESLFSLTQLLFLIFWGHVGDRLGRKPVLLICLVGEALGIVLFGFSSQIWQMLASRILAGVFCGNTVVVRTLFAEFSDSTNQTRAFSYFGVASNLGFFLGPIIGGIFSEPGTEFPNTLGRIALFRSFPYALPCLICGVFVLVTLALDTVLLREPPARKSAPAARPRSASSASGPTSTEAGVDALVHGSGLPLRSILTPDVIKVVMVLAILWLIAFAESAVFPVYLFTPVRLGGLDFKPKEIASVTGLIGIGQTIWMLVMMPRLDKRFGSHGLLRLCFAVWPTFFILPVFANIGARNGAWWVTYACIGVVALFGSGIAMAITSVQLLINNVSPPEHLGAINGFALTVGSAVRTVSPAIFASLFALSVERNIMGRFLVWFLLALLAVLGFFLTSFAPRQNVRASGIGERVDRSRYRDEDEEAANGEM